jgi:hypothetical protein
MLCHEVTHPGKVLLGDNDMMNIWHGIIVGKTIFNNIFIKYSLWVT